MTHYLLKRTTALFVLLTCFGNLSGQIAGFNRIQWRSEKIAPGLIWKTSHTFLKDTIPQNINILFVNLHKRKISLAYNPKENSTVSRQAAAKLALAAVNAGFFNIRDGGSVTYIKTGGLVIDADTAKKWKVNPNLDGALLIGKNGHLKVEYAKSNGYYNRHTEFSDVLVTGPLLIGRKKKVTLATSSLAGNIHPRTSLGKLSNHKLVLVTVDGRTNEARGMTLAELADLMASLRCKEAINLDGGGSTTMWIGNKPFNGVVNMPCDNKKFDHEGERKVSDILIVK
jgi:exopolysaccharide biosynthesis protein